MTDYLSDPSSEHPPNSSLKSERGSQIYQQHTAILQKLETLKEIVGKSKEHDERHNIFERSQFYGVLLGLLPDILLLIEDGWSRIRPIPQDAMFRSTFEGIRDLRLRWALWQEDAFQLETEAGSWESTVEFKSSTLCEVVLHKLSDIQHGLKAVTSELPLKCRGLQSVLPVNFLAVQYSTAKVDACLAPDFSWIAKYVEDMSPAIADLFDILPVLKEYDSARSDGELATFRGHLLSIKQSILQDSAKLERKSVQQQSIPIRDKDGFPVREHDDRRSREPPLVFQKPLEESMLEDMEACLRILDDIQVLRMDSDEESSVSIAEQPSVATAEDGQTHRGVARPYKHYTFTTRENWRVASRVKIRESQEESRALVAKGNQNTSVVEIMKNMSPDCRAQIDRLLDEKNLAERNKCYRWYCDFINPPMPRDIYVNGIRIEQLMQLEVIIARHVLPGILVKPPFPESSRPFLGKISNLSEPLNPKEKTRETLERNKLHFEERLERPPSQYKKKPTENRRDDKCHEDTNDRSLRLQELRRGNEALIEEIKDGWLRPLERLKEDYEADKFHGRTRDSSLHHWRIQEICRDIEPLFEEMRDRSLHHLEGFEENCSFPRFHEIIRDNESLFGEMSDRLLRHLKRYEENCKEDEFFEETKDRYLDVPRIREIYNVHGVFFPSMYYHLLYSLKGFIRTSKHDDYLFQALVDISLRRLAKRVEETLPSNEPPIEERENISEPPQSKETSIESAKFQKMINVTNQGLPMRTTKSTHYRAHNNPFFFDDNDVVISYARDEI